MANRLFLGLDLGGTNVKAGVVDDQGNALASSSVATQAILGPVKGVEQIVRAGREAVLAAGVELADISAVGLATPGTMDIPGGMLLDPPNLPGWVNFPIRDEVGWMQDLIIVLLLSDKDPAGHVTLTSLSG